MDLVDRIIAFECGELDDDGVIALCSEMLKTGQTSAVSGLRHITDACIGHGILSKDGDINHDVIAELREE